MNKVLKYILDRLKEKSTWIGCIGLVTSFGVSVSPEQAQAIASAGVALVAAVLTFTRENKDE